MRFKEGTGRGAADQASRRPRRTFRATVAMLGAALLVAVVAGCGSNGGGGGKMSEFTVALDWIPAPPHIALFWGQEAGFYEEEDLEVDLQSPPDASAPAKLVATNRVDLAITYQPDVVLSAEEQLGVVAVGAFFPRPLSSFMASGKSGVKGLADVKGETVGYTGVPTYKEYAAAALDHEGMSLDDIKLTNVGYNLVPALLSGKVKALAEPWPNVQGIEIELEEGVPPLSIPMDEMGIPTYNELLFVANKKRLEEDENYRSGVERFLAAYYAALADTKEHMDEAVEVMQKNTDSEPEYVDKSARMSVELMEPEKGELGCIDPTDWDAYAEWMVEREIVSNVPERDSVMTNEHLPKDCDGRRR